MTQQILVSLQEYYALHKHNPRYLVLPPTLARRFEKQFAEKKIEIPCIAFGFVVVEDIRATEAAMYGL